MASAQAPGPGSAPSPSAPVTANRRPDVVNVLDYGQNVGTGGDDSAAINAAIMAASATPTGGVAYFPDPPSGHYNICASHIALPGGKRSIRLEGSVGGAASIRVLPTCAKPPEEVLFQPMTTSPMSSARVHISDLTIDGWCLAKYDFNILFAVGLAVDHTVFRNAAKGGANVFIRAGYELDIGGTNRLENVNDPDHICYHSAADLPAYNLDTSGTDSYFGDLIAIDAAIANFYSESGGDNHFHGTHGWGYPKDPVAGADLRSQYGFISNGSIDLKNWVADYVIAAAVLLHGYKSSSRSDADVQGGIVVGQMPAGARGVVIDSGLRNVSVLNNHFEFLQDPVNAVVQLGTADPSTFVFGNLGARYSTGFPAPLASLVVSGPSWLGGAAGSQSVRVLPGAKDGDSVEIAGYGAGRGSSIVATGPAENSNLYVVAKGGGAIVMQDNGGGTIASYSGVASPASAFAYRNAAEGSGPVMSIVGAGSADINLAPLGAGQVNAVTGGYKVSGSTVIDGARNGAFAAVSASSYARQASYTFATLPAADSAAREVFCSDCLKPGEARGRGSGMMVFDDGHGRWVSMAGSIAAR